MLSIRCSKYSVRVVDYYLHHFQPLLHFSTHSSTQIPKSPNQSCTNYLVDNLGFPNQSYTNYLINHLGFSHQQAHSIYTNLRYKFADDAHFFKFSGNANSVIDFLKQHGFDDTNIKKAVSSFPQILSANVEQTLQPKFKVFQDHGFSESDLVSVISSRPSILSRHVDPIIRDLRAILGSNDNIIKFLRINHLATGPSALRNLNSNVALLNKEYGLDINVIRMAILQSPGSYLKDTESFQNIVVRVEEELGIPRNSGMFTDGICLLCTSSKKTIESKCEVLKSFGWTEYNVSELMRKHPRTFKLSKENIRKKLGFFMTEVGCKPDFLAKRCRLFGCSLENVLVPRHRVVLFLNEKGLLDSKIFIATMKTEEELFTRIFTAIMKSEKEFIRIFIEPFMEDAPGLLELYQSSKGYSNIDDTSRH